MRYSIAFRPAALFYLISGISFAIKEQQTQLNQSV
jgi:hypothetical protein